jgi:hypothetical protein
VVPKAVVSDEPASAAASGPPTAISIAPATVAVEKNTVKEGMQGLRDPGGEVGQKRSREDEGL